MINIKPFKAVRPDRKFVEQFVVPPYDVLSHEDCIALLKKNPDSFIRVTRSEVEFEGINPYDPKVYDRARANLIDFINRGIIKQDNTPSIFVYEQTQNGRVQTGFVAGTSIEDYKNGKIKRHEKTRQEKEEDRVRHIKTTMAHTEPAFMIYKSQPDLDSILIDTTRKPVEYDFSTDDGVRHRYWIIDNQETINQIVEGFKSVESIYIADGHHRSQSSFLVGDSADDSENEKKYFPSVIFPDNCLSIIAYNRAVKDLNGMTTAEFINKLEDRYIVKPVENNQSGGFTPSRKLETGMFLDGKWYTLFPKFKIDIDDPVESLDVYILQKNILEPILGIGDPRLDKRIDFIGGSKGTIYLENIVKNKNFAVAFSMFPTTIDELLRVADRALLMPPKSTWFEPKLISGLTIHLLD